MTDELAAWLSESQDRLQPDQTAQTEQTEQTEQRSTVSHDDKNLTPTHVEAQMSDNAQIDLKSSVPYVGQTDPLQADARDPIIQSLALETLRNLMQTAGYRVETVNEGEFVFLRSATNGLGFDIRPGNSAPGASGQYADFAFVALFAVRGSLPLEVLNNWNRSRRFGRLFLDQPVVDQTFLVFCMDVTIAGGITERYLTTQIGLWDGLVQQLIPWLREELSKIAPAIETPSRS